MFKPQITASVTKKIAIPESEGASITIKHLKSGIMQAIVQKSMQLTSKQGATGMASEIAFDLTQKPRDIVNACLTGWAGFKDESGKVLKFTPLNVAKMIDESTEFVDFVVSEQEKLDGEVSGAEEEVTKN